MSETPIRRTVTVVNPEGIHLRPAGLLSQTANQFQSKIEIIRGGDRFDGKSTLSILTLVAEKGTQLTIEAVGPDASAAIEALAALVEQGFPGPTADDAPTRGDAGEDIPDE